MFKHFVGTITLTMLVIWVAGCAGDQPTATPTPPTATTTLAMLSATPSATPIPPTDAPEPTGVLPTAAPLPPLSGSGGGVLAFTSERDGEGDIYVMNADGSDQRRLTGDPAYDGWPTWSPDGAQIAFCSTRSGNPDIYVMDADGGNVRQLTQHNANDIWPEWSPDGTKIAFPSRRDGNFEIYVIDADGTNLKRLTNTPAHEDFPAWSPDGTQIVFSRTEGDDGTYVMNADGSNERRLLDFRIFEPAWSPDGAQIAFGSDHEGFRGIYVMDADGSNVQKLSNTRAGENCPAWSPDGMRITFASWRGGDGEIYLMNVDGGDLQQLTDNWSADEFPAWRPVATVASSPGASSLGDIWTRPADGMEMVYVPGGEFQMGSSDAEVDVALGMCNTYYSDCERAWFEVEQPVHTVELDSFWIDRTELTNGQYQQCVEAGACDPPRDTGSDTRSAYYGDSAYDDYPVVNVDWHQADAYCTWVGGRLPTEAEWEYAARGPEGRRFPWGDEYDGTKLNSCDVNCKYDWAEEVFDDGYADTAPVGSYPSGASWCGAFDLAGNVWEWMADRFGEYSFERQINPTGPTSGTSRTLRGDAADGTRSVSRSAARHGMAANRAYQYTGFRCVIPSREVGEDPGITFVHDTSTVIGLYADEGAAEPCVTAATRMFEWMGYTVEQIFAATVNDEEIDRFDLLYFPGGSSDPFKEDISVEGKDKIRQFVESGGCFIGTCAGALFAAEQPIWKGQVEDGEALALFPGTVEGPIPDIYTDPEHGMCQVNLEPHTITNGMQESLQILYYNGPFFKPNADAEVAIIGRYQIGGEPALVASEYGRGRVFLTGPHPEWEEDDDRDGVDYFDRFDDQGSDWDLMQNGARWCLHEID